METYGCMVCDKPISHLSGRGRKPRYCSTLCASRAQTELSPRQHGPKLPRDPDEVSRTASRAATVRWAALNEETRSAAARKAAAARWSGHEAKPKKHRQRRACDFCGEVVPMKSNQRCCGKPECRLARNAERMRTGGWMKSRRAAQFTTAVDAINVLAVFERDNWTCGICGEPVDPDLVWPDKMSASLDHIRPLSKGGTHTLDNVRCAHLSCNAARVNREVQKSA